MAIGAPRAASRSRRARTSAPMRGWRMAFRAARSWPAAKARSASAFRSSSPDAVSTAGNRATTSASPGVPGATTSRATWSASITGTPRSAKRRATVLLPVPMFPVSPNTSMAYLIERQARPGSGWKRRGAPSGHGRGALRRPGAADRFRNLSMRLGFPVFLLALAAPAFASDLVGPESCRTCHAEAYRIWAQGPHARAVASFTADQRKSPLCLTCHSRDEQRSNPADPVVGVSCETCHGGGRFYQPATVMRDKELARLFGLGDAASTCLGCHGSGSASPQPFDVKAAMGRIDHWSKPAAPRSALPPSTGARLAAWIRGERP